jgi:hypothetical protein
MTTVKIYNVGRREDAEPLVRALSGKTFMNLEVGLAPAGGSFDVLVTTARPETSESELRDMATSVLVSCVLDMGSATVLRALAEGCDRLEDGDGNDVRAARVTDALVLEHYGKVRRGLGHELREESGAGYVVPDAGHDCGHYAWIDGEGRWVYARGEETRPVPRGAVLYADPDCTVELRTV